MRILNNKGSAMIMAIFVLTSVIGGGLYLFKKMNITQKRVSANIKRTRIITLEEKVSRLAGFLIASNLILCKQDEWTTPPAPAKTCAWNQNRLPADFGLVEVGLDENNYRKFTIIKDKMFNTQEAAQLGSEQSVLLFKLKHIDEISSNLGESAVAIANDSEKYIVEVTGKLAYLENGKKKIKKFTSIYRRPIAVPSIKLLGTASCTESCTVSLSENNQPECRSDFFTDNSTPVTVQTQIKNLGPGALYQTKMNRTVDYIQGAVLQVGAENPVSIAYEFSDGFIVPGGSDTRPDTTDCAEFFTTLPAVNQVTVMNEVKNFLNKYVHFNIHQKFSPLDLLLVNSYAQTAPPQGSTTTQGGTITTVSYVSTGSTSTTQVSQHTSPSGSLSYTLSNVAGGSGIEPLRLVAPVGTDGAQAFAGGVQSITTVVNTYRKVVRTHHSH